MQGLSYVLGCFAAFRAAGGNTAPVTRKGIDMSLEGMFRKTVCGWSGCPGMSREVHDARGIYVCRVCDKCEREKLSGYRRDIFTDVDYWHDEPIDD